MGEEELLAGIDDDDDDVLRGLNQTRDDDDDGGGDDEEELGGYGPEEYYDAEYEGGFEEDAELGSIASPTTKVRPTRRRVTPRRDEDKNLGERQEKSLYGTSALERPIVNHLSAKIPSNVPSNAPPVSTCFLTTSPLRSLFLSPPCSRRSGSRAWPRRRWRSRSGCGCW